MKKFAWTSGRILLALCGLATAIFPLFLWTNEFHLNDPRWFIHGKFHVLWQMVIFVSFGLIYSYEVVFQWQRLSPHVRNVLTLMLALLYISQQFAYFVLAPFLLPGDTFPHQSTYFVGVNAGILQTLAVDALILLGFFLDRRHNAYR